MDRLTTWNDEHNIPTLNWELLEKDEGGGYAPYAVEELQGKSVDALYAYENTNLTPDQIAALQAENERLKTVIRDVSWMMGPKCDDIGTAVTCYRRLRAALGKEQDDGSTV